MFFLKGALTKTFSILIQSKEMILKGKFCYLGSYGNMFLSSTNVCQLMALNNTTFWGKRQR